MRRRIAVLTILLFILVCAGCSTGDPIIGKWKSIEGHEDVTSPGRIAFPTMEFLSEGRCKSVWKTCNWRRLDDRRLEKTVVVPGISGGEFRTGVYTVEVQGNILTLTDDKGEVTKWRRDDWW